MIEPNERQISIQAKNRRGMTGSIPAASQPCLNSIVVVAVAY